MSEGTTKTIGRVTVTYGHAPFAWMGQQFSVSCVNEIKKIAITGACNLIDGKLDESIEIVISVGRKYFKESINIFAREKLDEQIAHVVDEVEALMSMMDS